MMRSPILALLLAFTASSAAAQEELPGRYEAKEHGFVFRYPESWISSLASAPSIDFRGLFGDPAAPGVGILVQSARVATKRDPEEMRKQEVMSIRGRAEYENPVQFTATIAGRKAPGLDLLLTREGKKYRLRRIYLVHEGREIIFQSYAPAEEFEQNAKLLDRIRMSFRLVPLAAVSPERALAARCGSELAWAPSWAAAAATATRERRAVLVYVRRLGGFAITDPAMAGLFMDFDIAALIEERFVPLVLRPDDRPPFLSHEVYGLSPSTFGSALLVVSPEGRVLATTAALDTFSALTFLRRTLDDHPGLDGAPGQLPSRPVDLALLRLRRGEDERAFAAIEGDDSAEAHRIRAAVHRRKRDGPAALAALDAARARSRPEPETLVDRARVLLRLGRFDEAIRSLRKVPEESELRPQALLLLGLLEFRTSGVEAAKRRWGALVRDHPESRWAWRAAAGLESTAVSLGIQGRLRWPSDEFIAELETPKPESRPVSEAARARREAIEALLRLQREDGSWIAPITVSHMEGERPHEFTIGVTALCAASLLADRNRRRVLVALRKADEWLRAAHETWRRNPPPVYFMDYTVWARATHLRFLARAVRCGFLPKKPSLRLAAELMADLLKRQRPGGGFSYYVSLDPRTNARDAQSISFVTAYVALALLDAKEVGFAVPKTRLAQCLDALGHMLNPNGTFSYMKPGGIRAPDATKEPGAAGRGPYCALALERGGRADLDLVRKTLALFAKHREGLGRERRKALMHTGNDAQGSHYIMFDYAMIAEAIAALPTAERTEHRSLLLGEILAARLTDGSYLDNPMLGRAFGSAMALSAYESLGVGR